MTIWKDYDSYFLQTFWHLISTRKAFVFVLKKLLSSTYKSRNCLKQQVPLGEEGKKSPASALEMHKAEGEQLLRARHKRWRKTHKNKLLLPYKENYCMSRVILGVTVYTLVSCSHYTMNLWRTRTISYISMSLFLMHLETNSVFIDKYISLVVSCWLECCKKLWGCKWAIFYSMSSCCLYATPVFSFRAPETSHSSVLVLSSVPFLPALCILLALWKRAKRSQSVLSANEDHIFSTRSHSVNCKPEGKVQDGGSLSAREHLTVGSQEPGWV